MLKYKSRKVHFRSRQDFLSLEHSEHFFSSRNVPRLYLRPILERCALQFHPILLVVIEHLAERRLRPARHCACGNVNRWNGGCANAFSLSESMFDRGKDEQDRK